MVNAGSGGIQVLHVDDEPGFADMAAEFVERQSDRLEVETAPDASEALERIQANRFHCVVSDYDMPGMNGIELLKVVREDYPDLPFILYTGKGSEEVASDAISAGVTDYLQKESGTSQYEVLANRIANSADKYQAQNQLEVSKRRLDLFVEQSPLGVIRWDENFELERMNEKATEILGYDENDLKGRSWEAIVTESDLDAVAQVVSKLLVDKGGYHSVNENIRKDGERIVCEWHNRVVTDDGEVIAIYSQFQDVTERRERERRFEAIFNNTHTFTGLMDPKGTFLEVNDTALTFGDVAREDAVGQPIWDSYWFEAHEDAQKKAKEAVEQARNGELFRDEVRVRGDDTDAIIDFSVRPVFDDNEAVILLVPEGRDITERKEREEELRETKAELEASINETERQNRAFEAFLDIVNDPSLSFNDQMVEVLDLGVEFLDLDIGIISNIDPPDYTVEHVVTPEGSIEQGAALDFRDTFCTRVYEADGPVAFHSPEEGDVKNHPCYQKLGLQAYLGQLLVVDGNRYGTLNFSSSKPREEPFTDGEQAFVRTITEWVTKELSRRQREDEIHRLHQLHQTVLSNIRETVLLTDDDGQITYVCPNVHFIFGYDEEEVAEMGSVEALIGENPFDPETLESAGEIRNLETTITDAKGQEHTVLVTVRRVNIEDGTRLYSIRDIPERKDRERELERMNDLFEQAQQIADLGAWETDLGKKGGWWTEQVNNIYELPTGYEPDPGEGIEYFHPDDQPVIRDAFERAKEAGEPYDLELRVGDGEEITWVRTRGKPLIEDGDVVRVRGTIQDITERKEREAELQQERARLNALFQHSTDAVIFTEFVGGEPIVRDVNPAFEKIFGYDEESAVGRPIDELVVPDEPDAMNEAKELNRRIEAAELVEIEVRRQTTDGLRDFLLQSIPLEPGESGTRTYAIYSDITERKEHERELKEEQDFIEQAHNSLDDIFYVIDSDGKPRRWNDKVSEVTGYSDDEIAEMSAMDFVPEDEEERVGEKIEQTLRTGSTYFESEILTADGARIPYEVSGSRLEDADGVVQGFIGIARDLTERKKREQVVTALHAVANDLTKLDSVEEICERTIDAAENLLHFDLSVIAIEEDGLLHPKAVSSEMEPEDYQPMSIHEGMAGKTYRLGESYLIDDARTRNGAEPKGPWRSGLSIPLGEFGNFQAVDESKGAFDDMDLQLAELLLSHTTSHLYRLEARQRLERKNERLNEFASIVSHDLRNPLNVASGRLELARGECDSEHLVHVEESLQRMERLIEDLLSLARQGESISDTEPVSLQSIVEGCWTSVDMGNARLENRAEGTVEADQDRLRQLFENLFRNAIEHGGEDVTVKVGMHDTGFFVEDDGPGIDATEHGDVFESGYTTKEEGTGFGLSIVRELVEAHNWRIRVTDGRDGGARFEISGVKFTG